MKPFSLFSFSFLAMVTLGLLFVPGGSTGGGEESMGRVRKRFESHAHVVEEDVIKEKDEQFINNYIETLPPPEGETTTRTTTTTTATTTTVTTTITTTTITPFKVIISSKPRSGSSALLALLASLAPKPSLGLYEPKCGNASTLIDIVSGEIDSQHKVIPTLLCPKFRCPPNSLFLDLRPGSSLESCPPGNGVMKKLCARSPTVIAKTIKNSNNDLSELIDAHQQQQRKQQHKRQQQRSQHTSHPPPPTPLKVLLLLRDPRSILRSIMSLPSFTKLRTGADAPQKTALEICKWMNKSIAQASRLPSHTVHSLWLEDLMQYPNEVVPKVLSFLGWEPDIEERESMVHLFFNISSRSAREKVSSYSVHPRQWGPPQSVPPYLLDMPKGCNPLFRDDVTVLIREALKPGRNVQQGGGSAGGAVMSERAARRQQRQQQALLSQKSKIARQRPLLKLFS